MQLIDPYIRPVDDGPNLPSQLGEVQGGDVVGIVLEATVNASEECLASPVPFVNSSTARTTLGCVLSININDWNPLLQALVLNHKLQPVKSPRVKVCPLLFAMLASLPYTIKLLHNDEISANDQAVNESPANLMENCVGPSALPSRKPFKLPPCGGSAFLLEGASKFSKMSPPLLDFTTLNLKPVGGYQQVVHPYVNANWAVAFWLWVVDKNGDVDVELLCIPSINELCVSYRVLQQLTLVFTDGKLRLSPPSMVAMLTVQSFLRSVNKRLSKSMDKALNLCMRFLSFL